MSGCVEVMVLPAGFPASASALAAGLGTAALVAGVGVGAYLAVQQLRKDYQQALDDFERRSEADMQMRLERIHQEHLASVLATALAQETQYVATGNATEQFLANRIQYLLRRTGDLPKPDPDLLAQCQTLQV
ncbi:MAG TPA: hypothetical protein VGL77_17815, partial [Armatimonadota bacterium]